MTDTNGDDVVSGHYRKEAARHGLEPSSTMSDLTTRELELDAIIGCADAVLPVGLPADILEVGCGNGHLLAELSERFPAARLTGTDASEEMIDLAAGRELPNCTVELGDARGLHFETASFDLVITERCLINLLDEAEQDAAIAELHRVLRPGGHAILVEAFSDGLVNLNRARTELGLDENQVPFHNLWFDKGTFEASLHGRFVDRTGTDPAIGPVRHFASTHYFMSRVVYPAVTQAPIRYNTEFVKFFTILPPHGAFSPIQLYFLEKAP